MENLKHFYSVAQAAEAVGVSVQAVYVAIEDGRVLCLKIGGKPFIYKTELYRWKKERERTRTQLKPNGKEVTNG